MIPRDYITEWRARAPWVDDFQVEQDLVISRALVEIFSHPHLREKPCLPRRDRPLQAACRSARPLFGGHRPGADPR